jgi:hypothetical protein
MEMTKSSDKSAPAFSRIEIGLACDDGTSRTGIYRLTQCREARRPVGHGWQSVGELGANRAAILTITWRELGGSRIAPSVQSGYGLNVIRDLIPHELGGTIERIFASDGLSCKNEFPLGPSIADKHRCPPLVSFCPPEAWRKRALSQLS